jgi:hypothetical protein
MSDEDIFNDIDFDLADDSANVDNAEGLDDTDQTKTVETKSTTPSKSTSSKRKSGKSSGKKSGNITRQQKRVPMHQRQPLSVSGRDPNFEYRVVNDIPGRVDRFKLAGWVPDDKTDVGDNIAGRASSMGSTTSAPVGKGTNGIVMKIPKDLYVDDQVAKQRKVDEAEEAMLSSTEDAMNDAAGGKAGEFRGEIKLGYAQSAKQ